MPARAHWCLELSASAEVAAKATGRGMPPQATAVRCRAAPVAFGPAQDGFVRLTPCPPALAEASASSFTSGDGQSRPAPAALHRGAAIPPVSRSAALCRGGAPGGTGGAGTRDAGPERVCPLPEVKGEARPAGPCRRTWSEADKSAAGRIGGNAARIGGDAAPRPPSGSPRHTDSPHRIACARPLGLRFRGDNDVLGLHSRRQESNTTPGRRRMESTGEAAARPPGPPSEGRGGRDVRPVRPPSAFPASAARRAPSAPGPSRPPATSRCAACRCRPA